MLRSPVMYPDQKIRQMTDIYARNGTVIMTLFEELKVTFVTFSWFYCKYRKKLSVTCHT